jgi:hypothetical protein
MAPMIHPEVNTRVDLTKYCNKLGFKVGAEIGVAKGKFSRVFCWSITDVKLYCIDPWTSDPNDEQDYGIENEINLAHAQKILQPFPNVSFIRKTSIEALSLFSDESLDFVYIDANHSFDYVIRDIIEWSRKVKKGGIVSGHDYYILKNFGVILAVNTYTKAHNITEWYTTPGDHTPSFWWQK